MGIVAGGFALATIIGVPLSLKLVNISGDNWHLPFLMIGSVALILIPLILRTVPSLTGHIRQIQNENIFSSLVTAARIPIQRSALIFSGLLMMGHVLIIPFINPYLEFNKGFSKDLLPWLYLVGGISSLIAALYLGRMADKKGKLAVFTFSVILSLAAVWVMTRMPQVAFPLVMLFFAIFFMVATGRIVTAQAMVTEVVAPEQRGSFMSINGSIQQLGSGIAALCAGAIVREHRSGRIINYEYVGYLSIAVLLFTLIFGRIIFRHLDTDGISGPECDTPDTLDRPVLSTESSDIRNSAGRLHS